MPRPTTPTCEKEDPGVKNKKCSISCQIKRYVENRYEPEAGANIAKLNYIQAAAYVVNAV